MRYEMKHAKKEVREAKIRTKRTREGKTGEGRTPSGIKKRLLIIIPSVLVGIAVIALVVLNFGVISTFFSSRFDSLFSRTHQPDIAEEENSETESENAAGEQTEIAGDGENVEGEEAAGEESSEGGPEEDAAPVTIPTIKLEIYEGPSYSEADDVCYYRVMAVVTGEPRPEIEFSKDDSGGSLGYGKAQVNLTRESTSYYLTATASNTEGTEMDAITLTWNCNRSPDIKGISLSSDTLYVGEQYGASVDASDLDGDQMTYDWVVSGGSVTDSKANPAQWSAPDTPGDYTISVAVNDGKGNVSEASLKVYVGEVAIDEQNPTNLDLPRKESEGGYIEHGGTTYAGGKIYAGDSSEDMPCSGFMSFDITGIAGRNVESASLSFSSASEYGSPLSFKDALWINVLDWGAEPITQSDFEKDGIAVASYSSPSFTCNVSKLKEELQKAISNGKSRFQVRIHFSGPKTNDNGEADGWMYSQGSVKLNVTLSP